MIIPNTSQLAKKLVKPQLKFSIGRPSRLKTEGN